MKPVKPKTPQPAAPKKPATHAKRTGELGVPVRTPRVPSGMTLCAPLRTVQLVRSVVHPGALVGLDAIDTCLVEVMTESSLIAGDGGPDADGNTDLAELIRLAALFRYALVIRSDLPPHVHA